MNPGGKEDHGPEGIEELHPVLGKIMLQEVDTDDRTFCLAPLCEETRENVLFHSVGSAGVLYPPIVRARVGKGYQLVAGWRYLAAARASNRRWLLCLVLDAATEDRVCLNIAFHDRVQSGIPISPAEKAIFFKKIIEYMSLDAATREYFPYLGLPPRVSHLKNILLLAQMEEPLLLALHTGALDEHVALLLRELAFADRLCLFDIISTLHLSVGNQKKLVETCRELAYRGNISIVGILQDPEVNRVIGKEDANPPQRAANLMRLLHMKRFPRLSESERKFNKWAASLNLPVHVTLHHAQSFEKNTVTLAIAFANSDVLMAAWPRLVELLNARTEFEIE